MPNKIFRERKNALFIAILALSGSITVGLLYAGQQNSAASSSQPVLMAQNQAPMRTSVATSPSADQPPANVKRPIKLARMPLRTIKNEGSILSAVAVDPVRNEIVTQDEGNQRIFVYDRLTDTPSTARLSEPKRMIGGRNTLVEDNCGIYVDPATGDIFSVAGDVSHNMAIFSRDAKGNVKPDRVLKTPHRGFGIASDETAGELFLTSQWPAAVFAFRKEAQGREAPLRILEGRGTKLAGTMGLALDSKNHEMYVGNWGSTSDPFPGMGYDGIPIYGEGAYRTWETADQLQQFFRRRMQPGTGTVAPPSITIYNIKAQGETPPLRMIQGDKTQLNWPGHLYMDMDRRELYVANTMDNTVLVFRGTESGNVAPIRVLKGPKTEIDHPMGVYFDAKNQEIAISNWGNQRVVIFPQGASGDVAPKRRIRTAPEGTGSPMISHAGAMGYDTKRDEILVNQ